MIKINEITMKVFLQDYFFQRFQKVEIIFLKIELHVFDDFLTSREVQ